MELWKKNYGTLDKSMVLWQKTKLQYRKLLNFDLLRKKQWYNERNYGMFLLG